MIRITVGTRAYRLRDEAAAVQNGDPPPSHLRNTHVSIAEPERRFLFQSRIFFLLLKNPLLSLSFSIFPALPRRRRSSSLVAACLWWTQCTMCTSSIVHASSEALPFLMSGHVCHLIVFSPPYATHPPSLSLSSLISCVSLRFSFFFIPVSHYRE